MQRRVSLYELKELLGHSSLSMVKRYAHFAPEHLRAAERHSKETASKTRDLGTSEEVASQFLNLW